MSNFSPTLLAELAKLDSEQVFDLLGEILEPSLRGPMDHGQITESFAEALEVAGLPNAYRAAYPALRAVVSGDDADPDAKFWNEADRRYDEARDAITEDDLTH